MRRKLPRMARDDDSRHIQAKNGETGGAADGADDAPDYLDIVLRATGWVYLATGIGMLGFFLYWLRG